MTAVARQHPAAVLQERYGNRLAALVPSHVNGEAWVRQATGTLRDAKLAEAAEADFGSFVTAVERAAVLGLRPGSDQYYLVPRKIKGRLQVQGIVGYQGLVDLMYRSGAAASVIVETVRQSDRFEYVPGRDPRPEHHIDWDAPDRGPLRLVYAYAIMSTGAVSRVIVLNRHTVETQHRAKSDGYLNRDGTVNTYSPWHTHEEAMWLKTAARQLAKWVPTSVEWMAQRAQAVHVATRDLNLPTAIDDGPPVVNTVTGELTGDTSGLDMFTPVDEP